MSLASVLYPPPTKDGWNEWTWANYQHHQAIETGLRQVKGLSPTIYRLWPVREQEFEDWLEQHQQAHTLFTQALGINGSDLSQLDFNDKPKRDAWMYSHFVDHQAAAQLLGLTIL